MKSIEIIALGIRLLGVYFVISIVGMVFYQYHAVLLFIKQYQDEMHFVYIFFAIAGAFLMLALLMIKFPLILAKWILPKADSKQVVFNGSSRDIEISAFVIIGVYVLSSALPDLLSSSMSFWYSLDSKISDLWDQKAVGDYKIQIFVNIFEIMIGLYLCLQAKSIAYLFQKLRRAGVE